MSASLLQSHLLSWLWQTTLLLAAAALVNRLTLSAVAKRAAWLGMLGVSVVLLTRGLWPEQPVTLGAEVISGAWSFDAMPLVAPAEARAQPLHLGLWLWAAGASLLAVRLVAQWLEGARFTREATHVTGAFAQRVAEYGADPRLVRLLPTSDAPFSAGLLRPRIYLPKNAVEWDNDTLRAVLLHEHSHVLHHDCLVQFVADAHRALAWPSPLAWVATMALRREREAIADRHVVHAGVPPARYAEILLNLASSHEHHMAPAMARHSTLRTRVAALLQPAAHTPTWRSAIAVTMLALVAVLVACADPQPSKGNDTSMHELEIDFNQDSIPAHVRVPGAEEVSPVDVVEAFNHARLDLRACYEAELVDQPDYQTTVDIHFVISAEGKVEDLRTNQLDGHERMMECLGHRISSVTYGEGKKRSINLRLRLQPDTVKDALPPKPEAAPETESTTPKIIREAMKASRHEFRACYEAELGKNPEFAASVKLHFTIEQDGTTSNVTSDPLTGAMDECLQKQVRAMTFKLSPADGGTIQVNYPLRFAPETPRAVKTTKSLTKEQVLNVLKPVIKSDAVNNCLKGKEALAKWTIGFDGNVTGVSFGVTPDDGGQTSACLKPLIEAIRFPASDGMTPVTFPLHAR